MSDEIIGGASADVLLGTDGADQLMGSKVRGGRGNDTISGPGGTVEVYYDAGDGDDVYRSMGWEGIGTRGGTYPSPLGTYALTLGAGIQQSDLVLARPVGEGSWVVSFRNRPGSLTFETRLDRINFADGASWDLYAVEFYGKTGQVPAPDNVIDIRGTSLGIQLYLGQGHDIVWAGSGNDTLLGEGGSDQLYGGGGDDIINGGTPNVGFEVDTDADTLSGGPGNDFVRGGGLDTLLFNAGDGTDSIEMNGTDTLVFGEGLTRDALHIEGGGSGTMGSTLRLRFDSGESVHLDLREGADTAASIRFYDGGEISAATLQALLWELNGQRVMGSDGDDIRTTGSGNDTLYGNGGNDVLRAGAGDDELRGGMEQDMLYGEGGNDTLFGELGDDLLDGGAGADTYGFMRGWGADTIIADDQDTILVGAGGYILRSDVQFHSQGGSVVMTFLDGSSDSITLPNAGSWNGLTLRFDDGQVLRGSDITPGYFVDGKSLVGTAANDALVGGRGDDTLSGLAGRDTLTGGLGQDTLIGGKGNDTYVFNRGDGQDTIVDTDGTWFNSDLLKVGDVKSSQLWFTRSGNNLNIAIVGTDDTVMVQDWFRSSANRVEKITALGDGKSLSAAKVNNLVSAMAAFTPSAMAGVDLPANTPANITRLIASSWM